MAEMPKSTSVPGGEQITKDSANYRRAQGEDSCQLCIHNKENASKCRLVMGTISPRGVCDLYETAAAEITRRPEEGAPTGTDILEGLFG